MQARGWQLMGLGLICLCWGVVAVMSSLRGARAVKPGLSLCGSGLLFCLLGWTVEADARRQRSEDAALAKIPEPRNDKARVS